MVISKKPLHFIATLLLAFMPFVSNANSSVDTIKVDTHAVATKETAHEEATHEETVKTPEEERAAFIQHHLQDSHDFHIFSYGKESGHEKHISFPLPVILWEDGLHFFMSSKFHHGEAVAESNGKYFAINHLG